MYCYATALNEINPPTSLENAHHRHSNSRIACHSNTITQYASRTRTNGPAHNYHHNLYARPLSHSSRPPSPERSVKTAGHAHSARARAATARTISQWIIALYCLMIVRVCTAASVPTCAHAHANPIINSAVIVALQQLVADVDVVVVGGGSLSAFLSVFLFGLRAPEHLSII